MANAPTHNWYGSSGREYTYYIYDIIAGLSEGQDGNYVFAKLVNGSWRAVYVGEGDLRDRKAAHLTAGCVTRKGATHFHCHKNNDERARKAEESDVLSGNPEAYEPTGCNVKEGG